MPSRNEADFNSATRTCAYASDTDHPTASTGKTREAHEQVSQQPDVSCQAIVLPVFGGAYRVTHTIEDG